MNATTAFLRPLLGAIVCVVASTAAHAAPTYSTSSLAGLVPTLFTSYTTSGNAGTALNSVSNLYAKPLGVAADTKFVYTSPSDGAINVTAINASSFSFLWGSPDAGNIVTYHTSLGDFVYTGANLYNTFGISDSSSTVFTASLGNTGLINSVTFTSNNIAFEVDGVRRVPEPGSVALVTAALGALAWTGRRRKA